MSEKFSFPLTDLLALFSFLSGHPFLQIQTDLFMLFLYSQTNDDASGHVILSNSLISDTMHLPQAKWSQQGVSHKSIPNFPKE